MILSFKISETLCAIVLKGASLATISLVIPVNFMTKGSIFFSGFTSEENSDFISFPSVIYIDISVILESEGLPPVVSTSKTAKSVL
jgi:hypothetical protein